MGPRTAPARRRSPPRRRRCSTGADRCRCHCPPRWADRRQSELHTIASSIRRWFRSPFRGTPSRPEVALACHCQRPVKCSRSVASLVPLHFDCDQEGRCPAFRFRPEVLVELLLRRPPWLPELGSARSSGGGRGELPMIESTLTSWHPRSYDATIEFSCTKYGR